MKIYIFISKVQYEKNSDGRFDEKFKEIYIFSYARKKHCLIYSIV